MQTMDLRVRVTSEIRDVVDRLCRLPADAVRGTFQQKGWIDAWLATHAPARPTLALATVSHAATERCLFALPLMLDLRAGVPCWTALDDGVSDYNAPILAPDFAPTPAIMRWIWARIRKQLPTGDLIFLEKIPQRVAGRHNPLLDLAEPTTSRFRRHPLALADGITAVRARYRAGRSLARKRRKLARHGDLDFVVLRGEEALPHLERLLDWRDRRYDARPITRDFYRRLLNDTDLIRLGVLRLDGRVISGCFGVVDGGALRLLVVAFDEPWKNWSPGLLAVDEMIGWACAENFGEFDFTIGSERFKYDFGVSGEPLWEIRDALRLRGSVLLRLLGARRRLAEWARWTRRGRPTALSSDASANPSVPPRNHMFSPFVATWGGGGPGREDDAGRGGSEMTAKQTRIRVVSGTEAVCDGLASLPDDMRPTAFQHPTWTNRWFSADGRAGRRTILVLVEHETTGRPLFALPLILDTFGAAAYWAPLDLGVCDYNASFSAPDFRPSRIEMRSIWTRILAALPDDASFLMIDKLPTAIGDRPEPLLDLPGLRRSHVTRHPLRLETDYATLRDERFSQTMVRSLARKRRKLTRKGSLVFSMATGEAAFGPLDRLLTWRSERYGARRSIDDFYRDLTTAGDPARVMWLALDGEPIAAGFGLVEPGAFRLLAIGHEERFKNWSPGLLLIEDAISWAIGAGLAEFDFTIGSEAYKSDFGVVGEPMWLVAEEFGPRGSAMLRLLLARNMIAKRLKRWIDVNGPRRRDNRPNAAA